VRTLCTKVIPDGRIVEMRHSKKRAQPPRGRSRIGSLDLLRALVRRRQAWLKVARQTSKAGMFVQALEADIHAQELAAVLSIMGVKAK